MTVKIQRADSEQSLRIVRNMFTAYFYDLSQYDDNLVINVYGLPTWEPAGLPGPRDHEECARLNWWIRDHAEAYVMRADDHPAGFLHILRDARHLPAGVNQEILDFYVAPKYRRVGVGTRAARLAFDLYPGAWQVNELARNTPALRFWHALIEEYTSGNFENLDGGTRQRFRR